MTTLENPRPSVWRITDNSEQTEADEWNRAFDYVLRSKLGIRQRQRLEAMLRLGKGTWGNFYETRQLMLGLARRDLVRITNPKETDYRMQVWDLTSFGRKVAAKLKELR